MRDEVGVDPSVPIIIAKRHHHTRADEIQSECLGLFLKGAVALIHIEQIRRVENANKEIEITIVIDVHKASAGAPSACAAHPGFGGHVLEAPAAQVAIKAIAAIVVGEKNIRVAVLVIVPDTNAGTGALILQKLER